MSEPAKNPFDLLIDQIRAVVREEIKAAMNGNGCTPGSIELSEDDKREAERVKILSDARAALEAGALLTAEQLAAMLQVSKATVYERVKKKTIPYHQAGRFIRFKLQEVLDSQLKTNGKSACNG